MNLKSPIAVPPDPLVGPRTIGDATDYIKIDPANAAVEFVGSARPHMDAWLSMTAGSAPVYGSTGQHYMLFLDGSVKYGRFHGLAPAALDWSSDVELHLVCSPFSDPSTTGMFAYGFTTHTPEKTWVFNQSVTAVSLGPTDSVEGGTGILTLPLATIPGGTVTEHINGLPTMLAFWLQRQGGHGSDTLNGSFYVWGVYLHGLRKGI